MVYTRTTFHCDILVSSYQVDHSIELSDASVTKKVITSISPDMINIEIK